ncbi:MAG: restriction endonuclease subunit S [Hormoscilla sp. SP5CHS1]|nr:restriction endonuclease subunit S [Hormoscilla sp. SP5CHS1]
MSKHKLASDNIQVPEGYKKTEVGIITEDWETCMLGDAVEFLDGKRKPIKESERAKKRGIYPYYGASGIVDYFNDYLFDEDLILLGEDGENILSRSTRLAFRVSGKIWVNNHAHVLNPKPDFNIDFLAEYLESLDYSLHNSGTAQPKLNQQTCRRITVICPPLKEQRAIAQTLSDVDGLIAALDQAIAKKRNIKTATMQELLTGKKRLPGFDGEWEVKTVEDIADCLDNIRVPLNESQRNRMKGNIPYCGANGILDYVNDFIVDDDIILMAEDGGYFDEFDTRPIAYRMFGKCWVNNHTHILKAKDNVSQGFLFYSLEHKDIRKFIASGTRTKLNKSEMEKIQIEISYNFMEQQAIASILSDMDAEIAALEKRRAKTQAIKQGMMQEFATQKRVIQLFEQQLGYSYLGYWHNRQHNRNIETDKNIELTTNN